MMQMNAVAGEFSNEMQSVLNEAKSKGTASRTIDGAKITINYKSNGPNVNFSLELLGT